MTILSSQVIKDFLTAVETNSIDSVYSCLNIEVTKSVLRRFSTKDRFVDMADEYMETSELYGFNELFMFGTDGILFFEQTKPDIIQFFNGIKTVSSDGSLINFVTHSIHNTTDDRMNIDDVAKALFCANEINAAKLDPHNPTHATYTAVSKWSTRCCVLWAIRAFNAFIVKRDKEQDEQAQNNKEALDFFLV